MSKQVRFRRGTTAQHSTFTGAEAEITVDTTKLQAVVHDGATAGGIPLLREDRPRGYTKIWLYTASTNWTQTGKTDLKRIRVTAYGGGGGGSTSGAVSNGGAGGAGGIGFVTLEANTLPTNVTVTIGAAGAVNGSGGTTSFGTTYISCTGGSPGSGASGGVSGTASGTGVYNLGAQGGSCNVSFPNNGGFPSPGHATTNTNAPYMATGGGIGGGIYGASGNGVFGAGGGAAAAGAQGCIIVEEIYGLV